MGMHGVHVGEGAVEAVVSRWGCFSSVNSRICSKGSRGSKADEKQKSGAIGDLRAPRLKNMYHLRHHLSIESSPHRSDGHQRHMQHRTVKRRNKETGYCCRIRML